MLSMLQGGPGKGSSHAGHLTLGPRLMLKSCAANQVRTDGFSRTWINSSQGIEIANSVEGSTGFWSAKYQVILAEAESARQGSRCK